MQATVRRGVAVPLRDGAVLRADVWGTCDDAPRPVLLQRTPYDRTDSGAAIVGATLEPLRAVERGFAVAIEDVRGRHGSGGTFDPFAQEGDDDEDSLAWIAAQPRCDGRVCRYGGSYVGATQLLAAVRAPAALAAVLATTTPGTADGCSTIAHDPADPVPAIAGATFLPAREMATRSGPRDRRSVQSRDDVLVFASAPLRTRRELTGELAAEAWVALDRAGGDVASIRGAAPGI